MLCIAGCPRERLRRSYLKVCAVIYGVTFLYYSYRELFISKLAEFRQIEKHLAEQLQALETLKGDAGLKKK